MGRINSTLPLQPFENLSVGGPVPLFAGQYPLVGVLGPLLENIRQSDLRQRLGSVTVVAFKNGVPGVRRRDAFHAEAGHVPARNAT